MELNYREVVMAEQINEPNMDNCIVSHPASEQDTIVKFQLGAHPIQHELNHKYYFPYSNLNLSINLLYDYIQKIMSV